MARSSTRASEPAPTLICGGCGGRNAQDADACGWCDRPLRKGAGRRRRSSSALVAIGTVLALAGLGWLAYGGLPH